MLVSEVLHQHGNVLDAFAKRRHDDWDYVQAIEQIVPEQSLRHKLREEILVGCCDHANVHRFRPFRAERFDFALLQNAQQLGLEADTHRSDLGQKDRAAMGKRELAFLGGGGTREAPRTWPKNPDSSSVSGMAAQSTRSR